MILLHLVKHFVERAQDKVAYTLDDLSEIVQTPATSYERSSDCLHGVGLVHSHQIR